MWLRAVVLLSLLWSGFAEAAPMSGDSNFAVRLYGRLAEQPGNLFFSPASIRMALAMGYAGARGETASEMARALSLPAGDATHDEIAAQLRAWEAMANPPDRRPPNTSPEMQRYYEEQLAQERIVLRVVNRLW